MNVQKVRTNLLCRQLKRIQSETARTVNVFPPCSIRQ